MSFLASISLRQLFAIDAVSSGGMGLMLLAGAGLAEGYLGIPAEHLRIAGLLLVPFAAFVGWLATRTDPGRGASWAVVAINLLWAVESILILLVGWFTPTALGVAFVVAQAAFVALIAELQIMALRRVPAAA